MHATTKVVLNESSTAVTLAENLAEDVLELAFADVARCIVERKRLKKAEYTNATAPVCRVEAKVLVGWKMQNQTT